MKIKTLNGMVNVRSVVIEDFSREIWVRWSDIKPILDELQGELARYEAAIENEQVKRQ